ncbi:transcriptional regulator BetI [Shimia aestuarii]|uniref:transcriptional regulator BetI n=1 Tax=Shimia aestuarii TaxID=254406 RepID=UPI001FB278DA|nr:transcriptional regulator BetI [Shimia aestuarii]
MARRKIRDIRHEELIAGTIRAVQAHGFAAVTMADIATEAGSTAPSITYYFGSKDRLMEDTMRHLLRLLRAAFLDRIRTARTLEDRLLAVVEANFADRLFTPAQCALWTQFWANAPHAPGLARLHRINRARVAAHLDHALAPLVAADRRDTVRHVLQSYMDGVWLEAAQSQTPPDAATARAEARAVARLLLSRPPETQTHQEK